MPQSLRQRRYFAKTHSMQPLIRRYAALVHRAIADGVGADFAKKLVSYLKHKGHLGLLPQIVRRYESMSVSRAATVVVARPDDAKKFAQSIGAALSTLGIDAGEYEVSVDDRAVGGYSVRAKGKLIDRTYRSALVELYQNSTN